ncbi:MAG: YkgJ family cysteine cluster protein [Gammaproteobacteria bacterium]|nr:MAG: YkgJ family cysteine cluster protein [Gammaproteobacteria bacterium]
MTIEIVRLPDSIVSCTSCEACCCRFEVILISDTGVPDKFIEVDKWGGLTMAQLDDGWCSALDRNTMTCKVYEKRPQVCHDLEMGGYECISARRAYL